MLDNKEYKQLLLDIKEISKISSKDNIIEFNFIKREDNVRVMISIFEQNGDKEELETMNFDVENRFQSFITPILDTYIDNNKISVNDFVDTNADNFVEYRLITYNNDQLIIDGLTFDDGFFIQEYVDKKNIDYSEGEKQLSLNKKGMTNTYVLITLISIISVMIALLVYFE